MLSKANELKLHCLHLKLWEWRLTWAHILERFTARYGQLLQRKVLDEWTFVVWHPDDVFNKVSNSNKHFPAASATNAVFLNHSASWFAFSCGWICNLRSWVKTEMVYLRHTFFCPKLWTNGLKIFQFFATLNNGWISSASQLRVWSGVSPKITSENLPFHVHWHVCHPLQ